MAVRPVRDIPAGAREHRSPSPQSMTANGFSSATRGVSDERADDLDATRRRNRASLFSRCGGRLYNRRPAHEAIKHETDPQDPAGAQHHGGAPIHGRGLQPSRCVQRRNVHASELHGDADPDDARGEDLGGIAEPRANSVVHGDDRVAVCDVEHVDLRIDRSPSTQLDGPREP
jgi:hypothetical protein